MTTNTSARARRFIRRAGIIGTTVLWLCASAVEASAQAFVTGSGNTPGFSIVGRVRLLKNGLARGHFLIVVHRDAPEFANAAIVCSYNRFDDVVIAGNRATFHSVGTCVSLTTDGRSQVFTSDNVFTIVDEGEPGPGADAIDVNFLGAAGVAVPGSVLLHGNFIVSP